MRQRHLLTPRERDPTLIIYFGSSATSRAVEPTAQPRKAKLKYALDTPFGRAYNVRARVYVT